MKRIIMALILAAAVLGLSLSAAASEVRGSVEVKLDAGELPVTNGAVTLYPVGLPAEDGYRLLDRYGGGVIRSEDIGSGHLSGWLSELAGGGRTLLLDVDGRAVFSNVEEGLYLLAQTQPMDGFYPFRAFLVQIPGGGQWHLREEPAILPIMEESPKTGDMQIWLAAMGMVLSSLGLLCCGIWGKKEEHSDKN